MEKRRESINRFSIFAWSVLGFNILVILWGAYVRASGSGAGCGSHWPLCNGVVIPHSQRTDTLIEFTHRVTSGMSLLLLLGLLIWAYRHYPKGHKVRLGATLSAFFILTEALVGASLVLFNWVGTNASLGRAISVAVHLTNTFMLLASLTLTAWWSSTKKVKINWPSRGITLFFILGGLSILLIGISGAITALGDTLFPAGSLAEGVSQDLSPTSNFLIRLRVIHPAIAVVVAIVVINFVNYLGGSKKKDRWDFIRRSVIALIIIQLLAGFVNVFLLAPVWMQLVHLLLADVVWISYVIYVVDSTSFIELDNALVSVGVGQT
jgi:heme A synthase